MPYIRLREDWHIRMCEPHVLQLDVREGIFRDRLRLLIDDRILVETHITMFRTRGYQLFEVDGRTLELRWIWSALSGDPVSIILMHKDHILIQYGTDAAAKMSIEI